ncbi:MAG: UDP-N-acetylglucosamine 2-epimerase (non-hydrolyzing) [Vicinamibacteria bacterium]|nr:UDP-N-acetylglucosamine 2-epimerase (non-hydrolyzing) [Vicinamibacteria bacterium]
MKRRTVLTVVGARPQFVKAGPLCRALRERFREVLVHTGQHYDAEMSDAFFEELALPRPDHNLGIGGGSHGAMTGQMLAALERVIQAERPDLLVVLGDTNSTLAGALAAVKLHVPVAHVEAGLRSHDWRMPEEINRRLTDHASALLFCPTPEAVANLRAEGVRRGVHKVGDVMLDAVLEHARRAGAPEAPGTYAVATVHRQENADDPERLLAIVRCLDALPLPVRFPVHPRTRQRLHALGFTPRGALQLLRPASYLEMLRLVKGARLVLTDSGGLQKEAFILRVPCVTLRDTTEWVETLAGGANRLAGAEPARIERAARAALRRPPRFPRRSPYGDGRAAQRIATRIERFLGASRR